MKYLLATLLVFGGMGVWGEPSPMDQAAQSMDSGDYPAAAQFYQQRLDEKPQDQDALFGLARAQAFSGQRQQAIETYTKLLSINPNHSDALLGRGRVFTWDRRFDLARADLTDAVEVSPNYADAWSALGDLYYRTEQYDPAIDAYSRWVALDPENPKAYLTRAKAYAAADRTSQAAQDRQQARTLGAAESRPPGPLDNASNDKLSIEASPGVPLTPEEQGAGGAGDTGYLENKADFGISVTHFDDNRSEWIEISESYRRRFNWGSVGVEALQVRRFDIWDEAYAVDAWYKPRKGVVLNGRVQHSPDADILPIVDLTGDAYIYPGGGWELLGGYRHMEFEDSDIDFYSVGVGKYIGNWYPRYRATFKEDGNIGHHVAVRYYYGDINDWVEGYTFWSESQSEIRGSGNKNLTGYSVGMRVQHSLSDHLGVKFGAGYGDDEDSATSFSFSSGVIFWW